MITGGFIIGSALVVVAILWGLYFAWLYLVEVPHDEIAEEWEE